MSLGTDFICNVFVPLTTYNYDSQDKLVRIAKKLKKNNVAVDIVNFGSDEENEAKLVAFQDAVNSGDNSHLVTVPRGTVLSDMLFGTPIFQGEGGGGYGGAPSGGGSEAPEGYEFGVDPNLDPELALALRVSLEEERARQNAAAAAAQEGGDAAATGAPSAEPTAAPAADAAPEPMDEDALLQQALAMSMQEGESDAAAPLEPAGGTAPDTNMFEEDAELQLALQMSMAEGSDMQEVRSIRSVCSEEFVFCLWLHKGASSVSTRTLRSCAAGLAGPGVRQLRLEFPRRC